MTYQDKIDSGDWLRAFCRHFGFLFPAYPCSVEGCARKTSSVSPLCIFHRPPRVNKLKALKQQRRYYQKHRKRILLARKVARQNNRKKFSRREKVYYASLVLDKARYEKRLARCRKAAAKWRRLHPEAARKSWRESARRCRARNKARR